MVNNVTTVEKSFMLCPTCKTNQGEIVPQFGLIACKSCRDSQLPLSERTFEFVPERIKEDRKAHQASTIQPFRNGSLSREYVEEYGTKYVDVTPDEVANCKYVWPELDYYRK